MHFRGKFLLVLRCIGSIEGWPPLSCPPLESATVTHHYTQSRAQSQITSCDFYAIPIFYVR